MDGEPTDRSGEQRPWLPDLCRLPRLLTVLLAAELIVVSVAVATMAEGFDAERFVAASAFTLWTALAGLVLLCKLRVRLSQLPRRLGAAAAVALPMLVAAFFAHAADLLSNQQLLPAGVAGPRTVSVPGVTVLAGLLTACVLRYYYVTEQWAAQVEASARAALDALQARIRPHFLFNSMNTIASLIRSDPQVAERAVEDLSDLFRAAISAADRDASLGEEVALARRFIDIESLRLGERLQVTWKLDPAVPMDLRLPALVLQPLLENAVIHGIARLPEGGRISVEAAVEADTLRLRVANPTLSSRPLPSNGHAQVSIARRLAYYFGPDARMTAHQQGNIYTCELRIPLNRSVGAG